MALLVPVIIFIGFVFAKKEKEESSKRFSLSMVPWFIFGFAIMSTLNTIFQIPENIADRIIDGSYLLMGMAMVGIGLNVQLSSIQKQWNQCVKGGIIRIDYSFVTYLYSYSMDRLSQKAFIFL